MPLAGAIEVNALAQGALRQSVFAKEQWIIPFLCNILFYLCDQIRRYGPPLTICWGTFLEKMHAMFGSAYVCEITFSTMKQNKSTNKNRMADETLNDSPWLAPLNTGIGKGTMVSEKPRPQASHLYRFVISYLLLCNNFYDALTYLPFFGFKCCEPVVSYIILLEVARKLPCFSKMVRRLKLVGPRWYG